MSLVRPRTSALLAMAAAVWILVDVVRVWAPSLITIFGQAATTPPELMGAYALGCVVVAVVVVRLTARRAAGVTLVAALAVAVVARAGLQLGDGGRAQLVLASVGLVASLVWLALAVARYGDVAVVGTVTGLAISVTTHAALGTWGAVWRGDAWGWALLVVQVALTCLGTYGARNREPSPPAGRRFAWLLMPGVLLAGIVVADAGRASAVAGTVGLAVLAAAGVLAVALAGTRPSPAATWVAAAALVASVALVLLVTVERHGVPATSPPWVVVAYAVGLPALATLWAASSQGTPASPSAVGWGALVWVVLLFIYYAGYDLGYRADLVVVATAAAVGVAAATTSASRAPDARDRRPRTPVLVLAAVASVLAAALGPAVTVRPLEGGGPTDGAPGAARVTAYNLRMGYGMDGTFRPDRVAEVLKEADVALLSEVDRGWYLNGGQDQLAILARLLDRDSVFAPAADPVWGDAVLSRFPIDEAVGTPLPSYGAVTGAQALSVRLDVSGVPTWFVSTHLQPHDGDEGVREQTGDLADALRDRLDDGFSLVLGGDLNTQPGSAAYEMLLDVGLVDGLGGAGPTSPADRPTARIDHLLVTGDLTATDPAVGTSQASDHRPVLVTVSPSDTIGTPGVR
ncbi:endonuclease/exonuclease/phosphatase family protein [Mumia sp. zg.B17]|uniref:endonuclease/exonuclease/phosphatase family protein n=1 Tax=Mumia sp. zg.B17 TaxID=2855446 RepID=UPI001C6F4988|nr:endonuclease/exonuclease/phosphatase family protein [Mumia sp. zg.B17]MBW9204429.1 endonuclease/exonuclease/phosphatase family protein [Mumia sp. zg.B17]